MKATKLQKRLLSGFSMGAVVVLLVTYLPPVGAWLVLSALALIGQIEFYRMVGGSQRPVFPVLGVLCGQLLLGVAFWGAGCMGCHIWEQLALLVVVLAVFGRQFFQASSPDAIRTVGATLLGIFYVPFLMGFLARLVFAWRGPEGGLEMGVTGRMVTIYFLSVVKFQDVGAYFTGRAWGRHKLAERLSPKKTWEGVAGGVVVSLLVSFGFYIMAKGQLGVIPLRLVDAIVLGILLPVAGVLGDLFESLLKRASDTKDSGDIIPGMGGFLDILDSLLFAAPVMYMYLKLVVGAGA